MKRITRALLLSALALALLAVAAPPSGAAGNGAAVERPYSATSTGTSVTGECDLTGSPIVVCPQDSSSEVIGTHVGRGTSTVSGTTTLDFSEACLGRDGLPGVPVTTEQQGTIVAADGSELYIDTEVTSCFVDFGLGLDVSGTTTIVGGSGRFEGASGSYSLVGSVDDEVAVSQSTGTITY